MEHERLCLEHHRQPNREYMEMHPGTSSRTSVYVYVCQMSIVKRDDPHKASTTTHFQHNHRLAQASDHEQIIQVGEKPFKKSQLQFSTPPPLQMCPDGEGR